MPTPMRRLIVAASALGLLAAACTSDGTTDVQGSAGSSTSTGSRAAAASGPAAENLGPIEGGKGLFLAAATPTELPDGWVEEELAVAGTATSYSAADLPTSGEFSLTPDGDARYRTRIVVRRPATAARWSGTVLVEWLNVSGGLDASPDFTYLQSTIERRGDAWVGVSAQRIGIEGGPIAVEVPAAKEAGAGQGIKRLDPERYGDLTHPGDAYSYDMFTQVARAVRDPGEGILGPLRPDRVLAVGESQSAFMLTTYIDGVQPITQAFDGFLVHSRGGAAAPLGAPGEGIDIAGTVTGAPTRIRTDGKAPVIVVETETDVVGVLNAAPARQEDSARFRWWEIAGAAHADRFIVGDAGASIGCPAPLNDGPGRFPVRAALVALDRWVRDGAAPPKADRIETDAAGAAVRDEYGNARGGIRTPLVDVPVDTHSGASAGGSIACILFGSTQPLTDAELAQRYDSRAAYQQEYGAALDAAIDAGFVLAGDRGELADLARPDRIPG